MPFNPLGNLLRQLNLLFISVMKDMVCVCGVFFFHFFYGFMILDLVTHSSVQNRR